jgi:hypothetical protein
MNKDQLEALTSWLKENVFQNTDIMFNEELCEQEIDKDNIDTDLTDIIASLHNIIYNLVTGEQYDYMFHWCNKIGADCNDHVFDDLLKGV